MRILYEDSETPCTSGLSIVLLADQNEVRISVWYEGIHRQAEIKQKDDSELWDGHRLAPGVLVWAHEGIIASFKNELSLKDIALDGRVFFFQILFHWVSKTC